MVAAFDVVLAFNDPHTIYSLGVEVSRSSSIPDSIQATLPARGPSEFVEPPAGYPGPSKGRAD